MVVIKQSNRLPVQPQLNRSEQQPIEKIKDKNHEVTHSTRQEQVSFDLAHGISTELSQRLDEEVSQRMLLYMEEMTKTQSALQTSVYEFAAFKEKQMAENPDLDLSELDLSLQKDGTLKLSGANLSPETLSELEQEIANNDKLKEAFTQLHTGIVYGLKHRDSVGYNELQQDELRGSLQLNELTERYNNQFQPNGFGQDYLTMEARLNVDTGLFAHFLMNALNPRISTLV
ncbi:hypothetical protein [Motilimonas sp. E26]|uniref:hypothetical protein n=1 Tax=Motilimonas sp. E26 TaxID=2865674 RepID=UPI001E64583C|nr:hypothetical protein [Motilimonas sp. E26]MCE0555915.1 hypothetical protein [Motilimonas sp. E26]